MQPRVEEKWRPPLALVLGCTFAVVLCLPLAGIVAAKLLDPFTSLRSAVALTAIPVVLVACCVGYVLWRILLRPITMLASRADDIRTGEAAALDPLPHYGTSEMLAMSQAMRQMGQVLQGREAVLRSYADHVTHELKSPLTVVQGAAELLADPGLPEADRVQLVARLSDATGRMTGLLDAQRLLARAAEPMSRGNCRLSEVVPDAEDVKVIADGEVPLPKELMRVVLTHLIGNARAHDASRITLDAQLDRLIVRDDGTGVSTGNRARVFDPFFTTRRDEGGTGMGLAIVRRMLEAQGAQIRLLEGRGAVFEVKY